IVAQRPLLQVLYHLLGYGRKMLLRVAGVAGEAEAVNVDAEHQETRDGRCPDRGDPEEHAEQWQQSGPSPASPGRARLHAASGSAAVTSALPILPKRSTMASRRARNAVTTAGSNCRPASLRMVAAAASKPSPLRYGRSDLRAATRAEWPNVDGSRASMARASASMLAK